MSRPPVRHGDVGDWRLPDDKFLATFHLPSPSMRHDVLAQWHPMPHENLITFDEVEHVYTFRGERVPRSVTGLLHEYTHEFNPEASVAAMRPEKREELVACGVGSSDDEILAYWQLNGEIQRARGQLLHFHAEQVLNGREVEEPHSPELQQARRIINDFILARGLRPFRTEVCLHHEGLRVAGQADLLCIDGDDSIVVCDWKRSREIRMENPFRTMKEPLENLPDSNYWTYALQLNLYAWLLSEDGYEVSSMFLFVVHPNLTAPRVISVPWLREEMRLLVEREVVSGAAQALALGSCVFD